MKKFFVKYFFQFFLIFFIFSCSSTNVVNITKDNVQINNTIELQKEYYALERDYNTESKDKTNNEILDNLLDNVIFSLGGYDADILSKKENSFQININNIDIKTLEEKLNENAPKNNPILYRDDDNHIKLNINVDNYMALSTIMPILENETFMAYTAKYNKDTSESEFKKLIAYAISKDVSDKMEKSKIIITLNDNGYTKTVAFSVLDFLLLHSPITL